MISTPKTKMNLYYYTYIKFQFVLRVRLRCVQWQSHPVNAEKGKKRIIVKRKNKCISVVCVKDEELLVLALAVNIITTRP